MMSDVGGRAATTALRWPLLLLLSLQQKVLERRLVLLLLTIISNSNANVGADVSTHSEHCVHCKSCTDMPIDY
jgi:hypothetical protein